MDKIEKRLIEKIQDAKVNESIKELCDIYSTVVENEIFTEEQLTRVLECKKETKNHFIKGYDHGQIFSKERMIKHLSLIAGQKHRQKLIDNRANLYNHILKNKSFTDEELLQAIRDQMDINNYEYEYEWLNCPDDNCPCESSQFQNTKDTEIVDIKIMRGLLADKIKYKIEREKKDSIQNEINDIEDTIVTNKTYTKEQIQRIEECEKEIKKY